MSRVRIGEVEVESSGALEEVAAQALAIFRQTKGQIPGSGGLGFANMERSEQQVLFQESWMREVQP